MKRKNAFESAREEKNIKNDPCNSPQGCLKPGLPIIISIDMKTKSLLLYQYVKKIFPCI